MPLNRHAIGLPFIFFLFDVFKVGLKLENKKGAHQSPFQTNLIYLQNQLFNYHHFLNQRLATIGNKTYKVVTSAVTGSIQRDGFLLSNIFRINNRS